MEFLKIVEEFVLEVGGKDAVKLLQLLKDFENFSEFDLAEELKLNINQVRNLLYKLNAHNLVYSNRKKDREKGWYIYYWTFNFNHARDILISRKEREVKELKEELEKEKQHRFFICPNRCVRFELEDAMEHNYKCTECGSILQQEDSTKKVNEIESRIQKLTQDLDELNKPMIVMPKPKRLDEEKVKSKPRKESKKSKKTKKHKKVKIKKLVKKKSKSKKIKKKVFKKAKVKKKSRR